jgi:anaerobic magnesium-protoporphyrin IX monomethyl ester cyclase
MRLLLVNVIDPKRQVETSLQPLGLAYLASYLRNHLDGLDIRISHLCSDRLLKAFQPDIVGLSSVTQNFGLAKRFARLCKARGSLVIAGGVHISLLPHNLTPDMDIGVLGEGEETMLEIVQALKTEGFRRDSFWPIQGLVFRDKNGKIQLSGQRPLIQPLDKLPFPARDLLYGRTGNMYLMSSRGCPFHCRFCSSSRFWGSSRCFSPDYVVNEILAVLERYRPSHISFWDDLFVANKQRLRDIVSQIVKTGIHNGTTFSVTCRAELLDEEVVKLLSRMNVTNVSMGLESGSERILKELKGEGASVAQNARAVRLLDNEGLHSTASFCIGSPRETAEDLQETLRFIKEMPLAKVGIFLLTPLPGTELWQSAKERGLVSDDMNWEALSMDLHKHSEKIIMASRIPHKAMIRWYYRLRREAVRKHLEALVRRFLRNPRSLPVSIRRKLHVLGNHLAMRFLP